MILPGLGEKSQIKPQLMRFHNYLQQLPEVKKEKAFEQTKKGDPDRVDTMKNEIILLPVEKISKSNLKRTLARRKVKIIN